MARYRQLLAVLLILLVPSFASALTVDAPEYPRERVDTTEPPAPVDLVNHVKTVCAAACDYTSLQSAVNAAVAANLTTTYKIVIGTGYVVPNECVELKYKSNNGWIYITTDSAASLPPMGTRISDAYTSYMWSMTRCASANSPYIYGYYTATNGNGAHHYYIDGLYQQMQGTDINNGMITFSGTASGAGSEATTASALSKYMVVSRSIIREAEGASTSRAARGIVANGNHIAVIDSIVGKFTYAFDQATPADTQAIIAWLGQGPLKIVNNHLYTATEVLDIGASNLTALTDDPLSVAPPDSEVLYNIIEYKPEHSRCAALVGAVSDGNTYNLKNLFESKSLRRAVLRGNLFRNYWNQYDQHHALALNSRAPDGTLLPTANGILSDLTIEDNLFLGISGFAQFMGSEYNDAYDTQLSGKGVRWRLKNNAIIDMRRDVWAVHRTACTDNDSAVGSEFILWNNPVYQRDYDSDHSNRLSTSGIGATTVTTAGSTTRTQFTTGQVGKTLVITGGTNCTAASYTISSYTNATNIVTATSISPSGGAGANCTGYIRNHGSVGGPDHVEVDHNTVYYMPGSETGDGTYGELIVFDFSGITLASEAPIYVKLTNNIFAPGRYGFWGGSQTACKGVLDYHFARGLFQVERNVFIGKDPGGTTNTTNCATSSIGTLDNNYYVDKWSDLGMKAIPADANLRTLEGGDYSLGGTSCTATVDTNDTTGSFKNCGTDNTDPGVNWERMMKEVTWAIQGKQPPTRKNHSGRLGRGR